jgi:hypothetical protein
LNLATKKKKNLAITKKTIELNIGRMTWTSVSVVVFGGGKIFSLYIQLNEKSLKEEITTQNLLHYFNINVGNREKYTK